MIRDLANLLALFLTLLLVPGLEAGEALAAGTILEVRLAGATGSRLSRRGDAVRATVIAPVFAGGALIIPQGATVSGAIQNVDRLGYGLKHLTSSIEYRFDALRLPGGAAVPMEARVTQVETARERVDSQGMISGIYPTMNLSSGAVSYVLPLLCIEPHFGLPFLGVKVMIARSPDPEIFFPAGTEMLLRLTREAALPNVAIPRESLAPLSAADRAEIHNMLAKLPRQQTERGPRRSSDLVNILFLGSRESIDRAFQGAGWSGAQRHSLLSLYGMYHCMVQRKGYRMAPMGNLRLNGLTADAEYQKSLDTVSKRHHLRLWKQGKQDIWVSAATEDVDYKFWRMHLTHATDALIDNERAKVVNDLALTGCVESATLIPRESSAAEEPDQSILTDGRVAALRMNGCEKPHLAVDARTSGAGGRRRSVQALVALRNDLIRSNPISIAFNTAKLIGNRHGGAVNGSGLVENAESRKNESAQGGIQAKWIRPSVLDTTNTVLSTR